MHTLKNLPTESAAQLASLITVHPNCVVSKALTTSESCQMMLFAFDETESVSEEEYFGDTMYYVLEGALSVSIAGTTHLLNAGDCFAVAAHTEHAIAAEGCCKMLQITLGN